MRRKRFIDERRSAESEKLNRSVDNRSSIATLNHMVESDSSRLDTVFQALADPTRRGMLASLTLGEKSVGELGGPFAISFAGAAKHVKVLEGAGLINRRKAGRKQMCSLRAEPLAEAERWLRQWEKFWTARLDRLEAAIEKGKEKDND
jgi:DNA-binding transcriptional ArsR family regulator